MLLTQHSFAVAAVHFWGRREFHRTSHSGWALHDNFKPTFRCALAQQQVAENRTCAASAIAHAALNGFCGEATAAMRRTLLKQQLNFEIWCKSKPLFATHAFNSGGADTGPVRDISASGRFFKFRHLIYLRNRNSQNPKSKSAISRYYRGRLEVLLVQVSKHAIFGELFGE